jgi:hypothetical protein
VKFGPTGKRLMPKVRALHDAKRLRELARAVLTAESLDEAKRLLR